MKIELQILSCPLSADPAPSTIELQGLGSLIVYLDFDDLTPGQKEQLKGEKGDPFLFEDFTPEQIAMLKQPATDAAALVDEVINASVEQTELAQTATTAANKAANLANDAATLANAKAEAANSAASAANTAKDNAVTATSAANNAADHANTKAGLANDAADLAIEVAEHPTKVVDDYWHQWNAESNAYENTGIRARGDVQYATFGIDISTGLLSMFHDDDFQNVSFGISAGKLSVTINP